jgi:hypothetical protein
MDEMVMRNDRRWLIMQVVAKMTFLNHRPGSIALNQIS